MYETEESAKLRDQALRRFQREQEDRHISTSRSIAWLGAGLLVLGLAFMALVMWAR